MTAPSAPQSPQSSKSRQRRAFEAAQIAQLTPSERATLHRAQRAARWAGLILPLGVTLVATIVTLLWVPRMPNPMAIHWGADMRPDGYGPVWSNVVLAAGSGVLISALYVLQAWRGAQPRRELWSPGHRFVPAVIFGTVLAVQMLVVATSWIQLDAPSADATTDTGGILLAFGAVWVVATVLAYLLQPRIRIVAAPGEEPRDTSISA